MWAAVHPILDDPKVEVPFEVKYVLEFSNSVYPAYAMFSNEPVLIEREQNFEDFVGPSEFEVYSFPLGTKHAFICKGTTGNSMELLSALLYNGKDSEYKSDLYDKEVVELTSDHVGLNLFAIRDDSYYSISSGVSFGIRVVESGTSTESTTPNSVIDNAYDTATVVNCNALNVRRGAGVSYDAFNHLIRDDVVKVLDKKGNWYQIETDKGVKGWVYGAYLDVR